MIFSACINLPASSHYKGMYPHGSPILWYIPNDELKDVVLNTMPAKILGN